MLLFEFLEPKRKVSEIGPYVSVVGFDLPTIYVPKSVLGTSS